MASFKSKFSFSFFFHQLWHPLRAHSYPIPLYWRTVCWAVIAAKHFFYFLRRLLSCTNALLIQGLYSQGTLVFGVCLLRTLLNLLLLSVLLHLNPDFFFLSEKREAFLWSTFFYSLSPPAMQWALVWMKAVCGKSGLWLDSVCSTKRGSEADKQHGRIEKTLHWTRVQTPFLCLDTAGSQVCWLSMNSPFLKSYGRWVWLIQRKLLRQ